MREKKKKMTTTIENKTAILADLFLNYRSDEEFTDFIAYNDIGLPVAYAIDNNIVKGTEMSEQFINETFELLLAALGVEDIGFETLDEMFTEAQ
jgi:hypothetical protein